MYIYILKQGFSYLSLKKKKHFAQPPSPAQAFRRQRSTSCRLCGVSSLQHHRKENGLPEKHPLFGGLLESWKEKKDVSFQKMRETIECLFLFNKNLWEMALVSNNMYQEDSNLVEEPRSKTSWVFVGIIFYLHPQTHCYLTSFMGKQNCIWLTLRWKKEKLGKNEANTSNCKRSKTWEHLEKMRKTRTKKNKEKKHNNKTKKSVQQKTSTAAEKPKCQPAEQQTAERSKRSGWPLVVQGNDEKNPFSKK